MTCPLGFHLEAIQPCRAFSVGQKPINFPMRAWSFIYWIRAFIRWLGKSILGLFGTIGLQVEDKGAAVSCWACVVGVLGAIVSCFLSAASLFAGGVDLPPPSLLPWLFADSCVCVEEGLPRLINLAGV